MAASASTRRGGCDPTPLGITIVHLPERGFAIINTSEHRE
jgi:hypothetical protein